MDQVQSKAHNSQLSDLAMLAFKKKQAHIHSNQHNLSQVSESSTHPL